MIKTVSINAKCSDLCYVDLYDEKGKTLGQRNGYVPDWVPGEDGDYVILKIDVETGRILNWKKPSQKAMLDSMDKQ